MNVRAMPNISLNSDHALFVVDYGARLAKFEKKKVDKVPRYRTPSEEQKEAYNKEVKDKLISIADWFMDLSSIDDYIANFTESIHKAAECTLGEISPEQRKSYISAETWKLIEERQQAREAEDPEKEKQLTAQIKQKANEDQRKHKITELEKAGTIKERWHGVNSQREAFAPIFNQQIDMHGNRIKNGKRADATAEYLAEKQWGNQNVTEPKVNPPKVIQERLHIKKGRIKLRELNRVIKMLKKDKAPGPDKTIT